MSHKRRFYIIWWPGKSSQQSKVFAGECATTTKTGIVRILPFRPIQSCASSRFWSRLMIV